MRKMTVGLLWGMGVFFCISCEMGDIDVNDFLNGMTVNGNGDNDTDVGPICGDGRIDSEEMCDDGNNIWGDGCNEYCWVESGWICPEPGTACYYTGWQGGYCGDGIVQPELGEECDYGGYDYEDDCSIWCVYEDNGCFFPDGESYPVGSVWADGIATTCICEAPGLLTCESLEERQCYFFEVQYNFGDIVDFGSYFDSGTTCQCLEGYQLICDEISVII